LWLVVLAVEEVAHGAAAGGVDFDFGAALGVVGGAARFGLGGFFRFAAGGATVGEAGLAGMELEFLVTNDAGSDWEGDAEIMLTKIGCGNRDRSGVSGVRWAKSRSAGRSRVDNATAGPSTTRFARSASRFAQDDTVEGE